EGLFDVSVRGPAHSEYKISRVGAGQIIGEMSWLDTAPVSATVRAVESSSTLALPRSILETRIASDPSFAANLYRALARTLSARLTSRTATGENTAFGVSQSAASNLSRSMHAELSDFIDLIQAADKSAIKARGVVPDELRAEIKSKFKSLAIGVNDII